MSVRIHTLYEKKGKELITTVLKKLEEGLWIRILPEDNKDDDIATMTNVDFDKLVIIMVYVGLLSKIVKDN